MPPESINDPIARTYRIWIDHGWDDSANGIATVASILRVQQVLMKMADQVLDPLGITFARYEALVFLYFDDQGSMPLTRLAKYMQVHQTTITNLVDKLEAQGLIERTRHPTDRRTTIAQITPAGKAFTRKAIRHLNSELFSKLALTSEEAKQLITVLARLRQSWGDFTADGIGGVLGEPADVTEGADDSGDPAGERSLREESAPTGRRRATTA